MSLLFQSIMGTSFPCLRNDDRAQMSMYSSRSDMRGREEHLWPRSSFRTTGLSVAEAWLNTAPLIWDWQFYDAVSAGAGQRRYAITGVTRDARNGAIIPSAIVKLYRTATDEVVDVVTSDANGNYVATSPYDTFALYAVAYLPGSPDIAGTTVNTLVPS
jgi:hypothetical protein